MAGEKSAMDKFRLRVDAAKDCKMYKKLNTLAALCCEEDIQLDFFKSEVASEMYFRIVMEMMSEYIVHLGSFLDRESLEKSRAMLASHKYCKQESEKSKPKTMKIMQMLFETHNILDELERKFKAVLQQQYDSGENGKNNHNIIKKLLTAEEKKTSSVDMHKDALVTLYEDKIAKRRADIFERCTGLDKVLGEVDALLIWLKRNMSASFKRSIIEVAISLYIEQLKNWKNEQDLANKTRCLADRSYMMDVCSALVQSEDVAVTNRLNEKATKSLESNAILAKGIEYCTLIKERGERVVALWYELLHKLVAVINKNPKAQFRTHGFDVVKHYEQEILRVKKEYSKRIDQFFVR